MQFEISAGRFNEVIQTAVLISTRYCEKEFSYENILSLDATDYHLNIQAYGGNFAVISKASNTEIDSLAYTCNEEGSVAVDATRLSQILSSFDNAEVLDVKTKGSKLTISLKSDSDVFQTMVTEKVKIELPNFNNSDKKEVTCNRSLFSKGMQKVSFAVGFEDSKPYYQCISSQVDQNRMKFVAGSGSRFVVYNIEGNNIVDVPEASEFIFPKDSAINIPNLLKTWNSDDIFIKKYDKTPAYISVRDKVHFLAVLKLDTSMEKYADVDSIINIGREYSFDTKLSDWKKALVGVSATYDEEMKKQAVIHNTIIRPKKDTCVIETDTANSAHRKAEMSTENDDIPAFQCNTPYFGEMVRNAPSTENITICVSSVDDSNRMRPVLVKYPETVQSANDVKENMLMFFVAVPVK